MRNLQNPARAASYSYPMPMPNKPELSENLTGHAIKGPAPFLKWAGGKRKLTPILISAFPKDFDPKLNRFFEPFVGGGALTFALGNQNSDLYVPGKNLVINDMNPDLISAYKIIRDDLPSLIRELKNFENLNDEESFYKVRAAKYKNEVKQAARFIYLNKTCFNGLWRVNNSGAFNVPFGRYKNPKILDIENLQLCSIRLKYSKITLSSFSKSVEPSQAGDVVYFDPPYIPLTKTSAFSQYAKDNFGIGDQEQLAQVIRELTKKGVRVILSNSDTKDTRRIFGSDLQLRQLLVARTISAQGNTRKSVHEVIGTNFAISRTSLLATCKSIN